jgi:hypothetical protein
VTYERARLKRYLTVGAICTVLGASMLAPLPARAQQVDAGPGDDIDVGNKSVTTNSCAVPQGA